MGLAHFLGPVVNKEGVETTEKLNYLASQDCSGYTTSQLQRMPFLR